MSRFLNVSTICACSIALLGCGKTPPADDYFVSNTVKNRLNKDVHWNTDCSEQASVQKTVQYLLEIELTPDSAVQVALLNNPKIQASFEEIGIAHADLIEAGLLSNPIFDAVFRFPNKSGYRTNTEISITQSFIDILLLPLKTKMATAEYDRVKLEVANILLNHSFEVERIYYMLVAAKKKKELLENMIELADIANQIATAQRNITSINQLELQLRTADFLNRTVELAQVEIEIIHLREELNKLMGITGRDASWLVPSGLAKVSEAESSLEGLESIAIRERLDIQAARLEVERFEREFQTVQWWAFTRLHLGVSTAREPDMASPQTTGPALSGEIPLFNLGQAARSRVISEYRQAQSLLASLEIEALADVRAARDKLIVFRNQAVFYSNMVLPNQEQIVNSTEELYNVMAVGIYDLLDAKRNQFAAILNFQTALKNYWIAKVDVDKALGGKFDEYVYHEGETP